MSLSARRRFDVDALPPTQYLVLEVLGARHRLGENLWPFRSTLAPALRRLEQLGLVWTMHGSVENTIRAGLTAPGRDAVLSSTYTPPAFRPPGARAGGGREYGWQSDPARQGPWSASATTTRDDARSAVGDWHRDGYPAAREVVREVGPWLSVRHRPHQPGWPADAHDH